MAGPGWAAGSARPRAHATPPSVRRVENISRREAQSPTPAAARFHNDTLTCNTSPVVVNAGLMSCKVEVRIPYFMMLAVLHHYLTPDVPPPPPEHLPLPRRDAPPAPRRLPLARRGPAHTARR